MKIALCGTWHVHARGYFERAAGLCEIAGVYEENEEWRQKFCQKYGVREFITLDELLESDADGVVVCTATSEHVRVIPAIAGAKKQIFTEKVLAPSAGDCDIIEAAIRKNGVGFTISLPFKYRSGPLTVKMVADSGELGKINYIRFRNCHAGSVDGWLPGHFYNRQECGGGAMIDLGAHGMYLIDWLAGLPETYTSVFTHCHGREVEDNAITVMSYPDGLIAINETGFVSSCCPPTLEVGGERGYVKYTGGKENCVVKSTKDSGGKVRVELCPDMPEPIMQFLTGNQLPGCGISDARNLTVMMQNAYANI